MYSKTADFCTVENTHDLKIHTLHVLVLTFHLAGRDAASTVQYLRFVIRTHLFFWEDIERLRDNSPRTHARV